jgi:hypothetical protein
LIPSIARRRLHSISCITSAAFHQLHSISCIPSTAFHQLHSINCIPSTAFHHSVCRQTVSANSGMSICRCRLSFCQSAFGQSAALQPISQQTALHQPASTQSPSSQYGPPHKTLGCNTNAGSFPLKNFFYSCKTFDSARFLILSKALPCTINGVYTL